MIVVLMSALNCAPSYSGGLQMRTRTHLLYELNVGRKLPSMVMLAYALGELVAFGKGSKRWGCRISGVSGISLKL